MKCVVQYTGHAQVSVANKTVGEINRGFVVYTGIETTDTSDTSKKMARRIAKLRIIPDANAKLNLDLAQVNGSVLLISQFTLCADTSSNRPSFSSAAKREQAVELLSLLQRELENNYAIPVKTGEFGAHMEVEYKNLGPITIILEA